MLPSQTPAPTTFGLVDYAGLAAKFIKAQTGKALGTNVTCLVTEGKLADGSAKIPWRFSPRKP